MSATETPSPPRRPGRPSTGARERLLDAAIEVLKERGYAGLSVGRVADRAGESKALIAYHFGSKLGLIQEAGNQIAAYITQRVLSGFEAETTVEGIVRGTLTEVEKIVDEDPHLARVYLDLAAVAVLEPEIKETISDLNQQWRQVFEQRLAEVEDGIDPARVTVATTVLMTAAQGLVIERLERGPSDDLVEAREVLVSAVAGLAA